MQKSSAGSTQGSFMLALTDEGEIGRGIMHVVYLTINKYTVKAS